jgi:long-chain acyl-CoA synthetase
MSDKPDGMPQPHRFSADDFAGFSEVFRYNGKFVAGSKVFTEGRQGRQLTYGAALDLTARMQTWFTQQGLKPGDRAIILSHDDLAVVTLFLACLRAGITAVIVSPEAGMEEQQNLIAAAKASAFLMDRDFVTRLQPAGAVLPILPDAELKAPGLVGRIMGKKPDESAFPGLVQALPPAAAPDDDPVPLDTVAYILFTSGTTSRPKGVEITHGNLLAQMKTFIRHYGYTPRSHLLNILPLHHTDGLTQGPVVAFVAGCTVFRPLRFSIDRLPALLNSLYKSRITHFIAVPAMLQLIEALSGKDTDIFRNESFRFIISTAGYLDPHLWARFESTFGVMVVNVYGLTETVCEALYCGPTPGSRKPGTIGKPVDTECRIVNDKGQDVPDGETGELWVRGPHIMKGYFEMPAETAEVLTADGWFKTGDLCVRDTEGFYSIVGRKKNIIIVGGINIYPDDVANILRKLPGVLDAAVWGEHDDTWGETVAAAVLPQPGAALNAAQMSEEFLKHGAVTMLPRHIHIVAEFPRGPAGKVIVHDLRAQIEKIAAPARAAAQEQNLSAAVIAAAADSFKCPADSLTLQSTAETVKGWSSLAHVEFMLNLEKQFGIKVEPRDILSVHSIGDALAVVERKKKAA